MLVHHCVGIAGGRGHRIVDCTQRMNKCAHIVIIKPGLMVNFRANVHGTTVNMVHIPEYGTIGPWQKQENAPRYQRNLFSTFSLRCVFGKTYIHLVSDFQLHEST